MKKRFLSLKKKAKGGSQALALAGAGLFVSSPVFAAGLDFTFDLGQVFGYSNSVIGSFMGIIMLVVGLALGFRIIRFIIGLF